MHWHLAATILNVHNIAMPNLERITTDYIETEDRVRLCGEVGRGQTQVIWLTQRLLQRLVPVLLRWLQRGGGDPLRAEVLHSFAQQTARAGLTPQKPVQPAPDSSAWLASSIDLKQFDQAVSLVFRGANAQEATLQMTDRQLRQWLSIVLRAYHKANWPQGLWPEWLQESAAPAPGQGSVLH